MKKRAKKETALLLIGVWFGIQELYVCRGCDNGSWRADANDPEPYHELGVSLLMTGSTSIAELLQQHERMVAPVEDKVCRMSCRQNKQVRDNAIRKRRAGQGQG